ncbi:Xanthine dehydrogenase, molybdopterin binding subunit [Pseudomonas amygdali pv. eriobotryae]|uniref:Xanthine dehydrogenase, molybdopterin binding subunit n=1 Tax=Pseudomonas amygdali pv. eriobotryae TaxID=129137 RepID=A0A3M3WJ63_PSEA0|nr:Xanthine dehydrogenase, molybdopterin binding subunit [Pseudomonas amygdali pv. eriobotryae]
MLAVFQQGLSTGVGRSVKHDSADKHVSGEAVYIDDRLEFPNQLHVYARLSDRAHARIISIDTSPCYAFDGVRIAITHQDIPGLKDIGPLLPGDPLLAIDTVEFVGQPVLAVAARDLDIARQAAMAAIIEYEDLEPVLDVVQALRQKHFVLDSHTHKRGDSAASAGRRNPPFAGQPAHWRPGTFLPGNPDLFGDADRRRRHDRLLLDPEPHGNPEAGGRGAGRADEPHRGRHAAHGRWFWRQGNPGGQPGLPVRRDCPADRPAHQDAPATL